jgi:colicin import membrane protein
MKPGMTISCVAHAAALGFALIAISASPMDAPPMETLPVSFISEKDFSQLTKGVKNAPELKVPEQKPLADKVDSEKSVDQLAPKVADKPAITTDTSKSSPAPKPDTPKPDPKPSAKADTKPDAKPEPQQQPKPDPYRPDQIAALLKKDAAKEKASENSAQQKQNTPKFDANQVAQLLDKREPQRQLASAAQLNNNVGLGAPSGPQAAQLSQSEIDALRARLTQCWNPPPGVDASTKIYVTIRVLMKPDGSLAAPPAVVEGSPSLLGPALAESAKRALLLCQPFTMLRPEHYQQWKDLLLDFNPQIMLGG